LIEIYYCAVVASFQRRNSPLMSFWLSHLHSAVVRGKVQPGADGCLPAVSRLFDPPAAIKVTELTPIYRCNGTGTSGWCDGPMVFLVVQPDAGPDNENLEFLSARQSFPKSFL